MDIELTEEERQRLVQSLLDMATGREYESTEITQTRGDATVTSRTEVTKPDKSLILSLLANKHSDIGGPQDYC